MKKVVVSLILGSEKVRHLAESGCDFLGNRACGYVDSPSAEAFFVFHLDYSFFWVVDSFVCGFKDKLR